MVFDLGKVYHGCFFANINQFVLHRSLEGLNGMEAFMVDR